MLDSDGNLMTIFASNNSTLIGPGGIPISIPSAGAIE